MVQHGCNTIVQNYDFKNGDENQHTTLDTFNSAVDCRVTLQMMQCTSTAWQLGQEKFVVLSQMLLTSMSTGCIQAGQATKMVEAALQFPTPLSGLWKAAARTQNSTMVYNTTDVLVIMV